MPEAQVYRAARRLPWFVLALLIVLFDQLSKWYFNSHYQPGETHAVIPGFFSFILLFNPGAAFSFLANAGGWQKHVFTLLALLVSGWLGWNIAKQRFTTLMNCAAAFISGGAIGNVIDRFAYGHVIDFILLYYQNWFYPAFNLADSFICVGAVLMVLDSLKKPAH
jgi:signal peptidase II